jgi:hypothetical protein
MTQKLSATHLLCHIFLLWWRDNLIGRNDCLLRKGSYQKAHADVKGKRMIVVAKWLCQGLNSLTSRRLASSSRAFSIFACRRSYGSANAMTKREQSYLAKREPAAAGGAAH